MSDTLRVRPGEKPRFIAAIAHNRKHVRKQLKNRCWPDGQKMYMVRKAADGYVDLVAPGSHELDVMRKNDDLLPAGLIGALVFDALHGHDAVLLEGDELQPIELKLALTYRKKYWITPRKAIYAGTANDDDHKVCFRSNISASYEIKHNLESKNVRTFLVVIDKASFEVIDCFTMVGDKVLARLKVNRNTGSERSKTVSSIELKLSAFVGDGERYYIGEVIGLEKYEDQIRESARVIEYGAPA